MPVSSRSSISFSSSRPSSSSYSSSSYSSSRSSSYSSPRPVPPRPIAPPPTPKTNLITLSKPNKSSSESTKQSPSSTSIPVSNSPTPTPTPTSTPTPVYTPSSNSTSSGGFFSNMMDGLSWGTGQSIAHNTVSRIFNWGSSPSSSTHPTTATNANSISSPQTVSTSKPNPTCEQLHKSFYDCMNLHSKDFVACEQAFADYESCIKASKSV